MLYASYVNAKRITNLSTRIPLAGKPATILSYGEIHPSLLVQSVKKC